jgi:hypothetical protein
MFPQWSPVFPGGFQFTYDAGEACKPRIRNVEIIRPTSVPGWYDVTCGLPDHPSWQLVMTERQIVDHVRREDSELAESFLTYGITLTDSDRALMRLESGAIDRITYSPYREYKAGRIVMDG